MCRLKMYSTIILIVSSVCWLSVTSQPTRSYNYKDRCEASSTEINYLRMELRNIKHQINAKDQDLPHDCSEIKKLKRASDSGIYTIKPTIGASLQVYCDMTTDGGDWLVFQRRQDGTENFHRNWEDYRHGFGRFDGEFWLGNDALAAITNQKSYELRVDLKDYQNVIAHAVYTLFSIDGRDEYRLTLGDYDSTGTAGDSLMRHSDSRFSTYDNDNDNSSKNCAEQYRGAWWYSDCHDSNLNGQYEDGVDGKYVGWYAFRGLSSLKFTEMKIRPTS